MIPQIVIITEIISPYRIPIFNAAAHGMGLNLHVIFLSETDLTLRQWHVYKEEIRFSFEVLPSCRWRISTATLLLNRGLRRSLERSAPHIIVCGGYNYLASWQAALWAHRHHVPFILWSESTARDARKARGLPEYAKNQFIKWCDAFLVPGTAARNYLLSMGVEEKKIYTAPNAVDVTLFSDRARLARQNANDIRRRFSLPERFFLYAGRLVREKGVFELLAAYRSLSEEIRSRMGLVFAGEGDAKQQLEAQASTLERVRLLGFLHREELSEVYGVADAFVFATQSDPWGLVVNEAMACGLPVLVSDVAGCADDLVENAWNGFLLPALDLEQWSMAMSQIAIDEELRLSMGRNSSEKIQKFRPQDWAAGLAQVACMMEGV